jgi:choline monooxygenase
MAPAVWSGVEGFARLRDQILARTWHFLGNDRDVRTPGSWAPMTLMPGSLDEPVLVVNDGGVLRAFSNVCTHRLATVCDRPGTGRMVRCPYHGRAFGLDGRCRGQPGIGGVEAWVPTDADHLVSIPLARWGGMLFASLDPERSFEDDFGPLRQALPCPGLAEAEVLPGPVYDVAAPAVAWVENFLEGLHIPFVHPGLQRLLAGYRVIAWEGGASAQGSVVRPDVPALDLPEGHPFFGDRIGGIYACLFPFTMFNLYPWGVSLNLVQPRGPDQVRIVYQAWVVDPARRGYGAGSDLDTVEAEDQQMVARVAQGVRSRFARAPRLVPGAEDGVLAWHREAHRRLGLGSPAGR